ncbi:MAG: SBBP repeat-containing protein, partial [candidate division WOR-3 bacterium]|nr:SBBP repeat-containing protein [candidate division WOR-3 bacterium]
MKLNNWKKTNPLRRKNTEKNSVSSVCFGVFRCLISLRRYQVTMLLIGLISFAVARVDTAWVRRYNGPGNGWDEAKAIAVDGAGNVYVTGWSPGSGTFDDYATIKYNPAGDSLWVKRYNGPGNSTDLAKAIAVDGTGNVYVTGHSKGSGTGTYDYATIKYNPEGDSLWVQRYNGPGNLADQATAIAVDGTGNVYVTGYSFGSGTLADYATIKYNPEGDTLWVRRYNGPANDFDEAKAIAVDGSGNVYFTGFSTGSGTSRDYTTIKYNPAGVEQWVGRYNGPANDWDEAYAIAVDDSGNIYVTGYSSGSGTSYDYATIKYNPEGDSLWVQRYNGPGNLADQATAIAVDGEGNAYVTGYSKGTNDDYATIKYNPEGDTLWVRRYNGPANSADYAYAIAVDGTGNVYVTGYSMGSGTGNDYATIKYGSDGTEKWVQRYNGPGNGTDYANAIAVDGSGNVYVTGNSMGSGTSMDYATIKYLSSGPGVSEELCGNDPPKADQITIQPNPAINVAAVRYTLPKPGPVSIKLYDITGAMVKSYAVFKPTKDGVFFIDAKALPTGVYILRF